MQSDTIKHLKELRSRLAWCLAIFLVVFLASFLNSDYILQLISTPVATEFIYTNLFEVLISKLHISLFVAICCLLPVFSLHIYRFASPGLYAVERTAMAAALLMITGLFFAGIFFGYKFLLPWACKFFSDVAGATFMPKVGEFTGLFINYSTALGLAFQFPVILIALMFLGIISAKRISKMRRLFIVLIFIIAAIITPPDVLSQLAVAIPMIVLFELSLLVGRACAPKTIAKH